MKYTEQLKDNGAVIGYKPNLQLSKTEQNTKTQNNEDTITLLRQFANDYSQYTKTIQGYLTNTPAIVLSNIQDLQKTIIEIKERLITEYKKKNYEHNDLENFLYSVKNKTKYHMEILEATDCIDGDIIPQILKIISEEEDFIDSLEKTFKKLYYGNSDISDNERGPIDEKITTEIMNNDLSGIGNNYLVLAKDAQLNKSICLFTDYLDGALLRLEDCAYIITEDSVLNSDLKESMIFLYNDTKREQEETAKMYEERHKNLDTCTKSLYNYYEKRDKMNQYYTLLLSGGTDSEYLTSKTNVFIKGVDRAIEELNKTLLSNVQYIKKMDEYLTEKKRLNLLSATINYN